MNIINLTPHAITIESPSGERTTFPASGNVARVSQITSETSQVISGIPVSTSSFGEVIGLPTQEDNTIFIVSGLVLGACKNRNDVIAPLTDSSAIRNEAGHIVAVKGWLRN